MRRHVQHLAEDVAELGDVFRVVQFVAQFVHHADFDELAELPDDWLPERVHLYRLDVLQTACIFATFGLFCTIGRLFRLRCLQRVRR